MPKPVLWFVTDPMCSWCWGMLPDFEQVRLHLGDSVEYELMLGGVQLGAKGQLASYNETMLFSLWREVTAVTGQQFSGRLPNTPGFRYHSEMACRALQVMRRQLDAPPFGLLHDLQAAFYLEARDISNPEVLADIAGAWAEDRTGFIGALHAPDVIETTRAEFETAKRLGAVALPTVLLDLGEGPKLVSGGYASAEFLLQDLRYWLQPG